MMANLAKKNDEKDTTIAKLRQEIASLDVRKANEGEGGEEVDSDTLSSILY